MAKKQERLRAFGYIRVSTSMQVEGGYSLDDQENRIREHAKREDIVLVDIFRDEGKSGKNISGRPGFRQMLDRIRGGEKVDYVFVTRLSRFGRNASDVMTSLKTLQSHGVALWCIEDKLDSSTKMGDAMLKMSSIFAEMERENIREQTRAGRYEKARQGLWNGGQAPYGYKLGRNEDGTSTGILEIYEEEAQVVRKIFDMYANESVGISGISKWLNSNGVKKVPRGNGEQTFFTPTAVKKILENPVYAGKIMYGKRRMTLVEGSDNEYRPKAQSDYKIYEGRHEAIVDEETFEKVSERRRRESVAFPRKRDEHVSILSGLLVCPVCGHALISTHTKGRMKKDGTPGKETYGYRCKYTRQSHGGICTFTKQIPQHVLHEEMDELFAMIWRSSDLLSRVRGECDEELDEEKLGDEIIRLKKLSAASERKIAKLSETIDRLDPSDASYDRKYDDMQKRLDGLYEEQADIEEELEEVQGRLDARENIRDAIEQAAFYMCEVVEKLDKLDEATKAILYREVFDHIEIDADANYRKGERVIKKVFLRVPVSFWKNEQASSVCVPGDTASGEPYWMPENCRVKGNTDETEVLMSRDK